MTTRLSRLVTLGAAGLLVVAGAAPAAAQDKVSIEMIQSGYTDDMQPYFDDLAARFMEANPDIDVSVQVVSWNDIYDVLNTRVASGDPPDIMNLNYFANFAADGLLYTAEEIVAPEVLEDFIQAFRDNSKYDGVEYAVAGPRQRPPLLLQQGHPRGRGRGPPRRPPGARCWPPARPSRPTSPASSPSPSRSAPRRPRPSSSSGPAATAVATSATARLGHQQPREPRDAGVPADARGQGLHAAEPRHHRPHLGRLAALRAGRGGHGQRRRLLPRRAREHATRAT